jgi:hypothetical protein
MCRNKILLIGDSFSSSNHQDSWTKLLPNFDIVNLSSNGSSEYRIFKKLVKTDLTQFDYIVIVHTSPYRIYIDHNPLHVNSQTHQTCDLLYQDVKSAKATKFTQNVAWYFENIFNLDQADVIHDLLIEKIVKLTEAYQCLHLSFFEAEKNSNVVNLHSIWHEHPGSINHLDNNGNKKVAKFITTMYNTNTNIQKDLI